MKKFKLTCTDNQTKGDLNSNKAHGHFGDCGEFGQNSGPNVSMSHNRTAENVAKYYLDMMWSGMCPLRRWYYRMV